MLNSSMWHFSNMVAPDASEAWSRQDTIERTRAAVLRAAPMGDMQVTGSTATGLTLPTSDIDLVLMIPGQGSEARHESMTLL